MDSSRKCKESNIFTKTQTKKDLNLIKNKLGINKLKILENEQSSCKK